MAFSIQTFVWFSISLSKHLYGFQALSNQIPHQKKLFEKFVNQLVMNSTLKANFTSKKKYLYMYKKNFL